MKPAKSAVASRPAPTAAEIQEYLPLVHQVVARFMGKLPPNVLREDLVAAGTFGLIDSLRRNGDDRSVTFEWYARIRIRGAIVDELRNQDWLTRRARSKVTAQNAQNAAAGISAPASSRSAVLGFDDLPGGAALNFVSDDARSPLDMVESAYESRALAKAVESLPPREKKIISLHYFQGTQLKQIASELGVSEPRVSQLHARAVDMLRSALQQAA